MPTPAAITAALLLVRSHHPEVTQVFFGRGDTWHFMDDNCNAPEFGNEIDGDVLHAALAAAGPLPAAFALDLPL